MNDHVLEILLAELYTDEQKLKNFLNDPYIVLNKIVLSDSQRQDLLNIDRAGLILAHRSYKKKREKCLNHHK